jgi:hypothetical protein
MFDWPFNMRKTVVHYPALRPLFHFASSAITEIHKVTNCSTEWFSPILKRRQEQKGMFDGSSKVPLCWQFMVIVEFELFRANKERLVDPICHFRYPEVLNVLMPSQVSFSWPHATSSLVQLSFGDEAIYLKVSS